MADEFKYWAFVSYSWKDKAWSTWLHRQLDGYRPPRRLVGRVTRDGPLPKEMLPVFRDREDLAGATDLTDSLHSNLRASQYLIVVCSPNSAASNYVNKEVAYFKSLGREERVFCFIVAGSPGAKDQTCCYPPAVREKFDRGGERTAEEAHPLAPDARPQGDGKWKARTKLIAGLLGVANNELARREWWRTFWQRVRLGSAAVLAIAAIGLTARFAWSQHREHLIEQGRTNLLAGKADVAFDVLSQAYSAGENSPAVCLMLRQARLGLPNGAAFKPGNELFFASFDADDTHLLTASQNGTAVVYDLKTFQPGAVFRSHSNACINSAVFNRDGSRVLTASDDGCACLWDSRDTRNPTQPIATFQHAKVFSKIFPAVFSPNEKLVATTGANGIAKLWDAQTKGTVSECRTEFRKHLTAADENNVDSLVFNQDGTKIVTAGRIDKTARVWSAVTGQEISEIPLPETEGVHYAEFSPDDGKRVVTSTWSGEADLWNIDGQPTAVRLAPLIKRLGVRTRRAHFNHDGTQLVTASSDGLVRIFDGRDGTLLAKLNHSGDSLDIKAREIREAVFSRTGDLVASAGGDRMVKLWQPAIQEEPLAVIEGHGNWVNRVEFSHDMTRLSSAGQDGYAFIWDITDPRTPRKVTRLPVEPAYLATLNVGSRTASLLLHRENNAADFITKVRFSPEPGSRYALTIEANGTASVWDAKSGRFLTTLPADRTKMPTFLTTDAQFDRGANRVIAGAKDGRVFVSNVAPPRSRVFEAQTIGGHEVHSVQFAADVNLIIVAGKESAEIWNLRTKDRVAELKGKLVAASGNGEFLALEYGDDLRKVRIYRCDGTTVGELPTLDDQLNCMNFSADGKFLVGATAGKMTVWETNGNLRFTKLADSGNVWFAGFSPDGSCLVTLGTDNEAKLWRASDGELLGPLVTPEGQNFANVPGRRDHLPTATFSEDSLFVCTGSFETSVRVWDVATRLEVARLTGFPKEVTTAAFAPHASKLLAGSSDGTARIWNLDYETDSPETVAEFARMRRQTDAFEPSGSKR